MKTFLIIGLGRFGTSLAESLYKLGNDVLVLDKSTSLIQQISGSVTDAVSGDGCDINVLKAIDAPSFDCAVVSMSAELEASILITYNLKTLGVKNIVTKASSDAHEDILKKIGADKVVFPEKNSAEKLAKELSSKEILDFLELSEDVSIVEMALPKKWAGKSLSELSVRSAYGVNVIAIRDGDSGKFSVTVDPNRPFSGTDTIVIIGENNKIERLKK